jgi:hypothetical protein
MRGEVVRRLDQAVPLLQHALQAASAFTPERLMAAVRAERGLQQEAMPPLCVLDFDGDLADGLANHGLSAPLTSWACFHTSMQVPTLEGLSCGVVPRTIGGPYAVLVAEQLRAAGAEVIVGLTSAGRVSPSLPLPSILVIDEAVRDEGTSLHYRRRPRRSLRRRQRWRPACRRVGHVGVAGAERHRVDNRCAVPITPAYFRASGTELVAGRDFDWHDLEQDRLVSIVDQTLAARTWPGEDAVGKRLRIERWSASGGQVHLEALWTEVVGVAGTVRSGTLRGEDIETIYLPYGLHAVTELSLLVRSPAEAGALARSIRDAAAAVDPDVILRNLRPTEEFVADSVAAERFSVILLGAFSLAGCCCRSLGSTACSRSSWGCGSGNSAYGWRWAPAAGTSDAVSSIPVSD